MAEMLGVSTILLGLDDDLNRDESTENRTTSDATQTVDIATLERLMQLFKSSEQHIKDATAKL